MCLTPIQVKDKRTKEFVTVPCSRCPECLSKRISGWSHRLRQESKDSISSYFLTLTYDNESVPITRNNYMGLFKRDVQLFFKRIRKRQMAESSGQYVGRSIKYYCVGEYGGRYKRPHYHVLLYNVQLELMVSWQDMLILNTRGMDGKIPVKFYGWDKGNATIGKLTPASVGYTLKYCTKPKKIPMHRNDDRLPEFSLMSKGLGIGYVNEAIKAWHHADHLNRMHIVIEGGKKISMPRYYKDKIYTRDMRSEIAGYQKGEIEKRILDEYKKNPDDAYWRNKHQAIEAAFNVMHMKSEQTRKNNF